MSQTGSTRSLNSACKVLQVSTTATRDEVRAAYRKLALKWHPDKVDAGSTKDPERVFIAITEAYQMLMDAYFTAEAEHTQPDAPPTCPSPLKAPDAEVPVEDPPPVPGGSRRTSSSRSQGSSKHADTEPPASPKPPSSAKGSSSRSQGSGKKEAGSQKAPSSRGSLPSSTTKAGDELPPSSPPSSSPKAPSPSRLGRDTVTPHMKAHPRPYLRPVRNSNIHKRRKTHYGEGRERTLRLYTKSKTKRNQCAYTLEATLSELFRGTEFDLVVARWSREGTKEDFPLTLDIPPGAHHGMRIRCPNMGNARPNGSREDLVFVVHQLPHPLFRRSGNDLFVDFVLGDVPKDEQEVVIRGVNGRKVVVPTPRRWMGGLFASRVVVGEGMPVIGKQDSRGNLIIRWQSSPVSCSTTSSTISRWTSKVHGVLVKSCAGSDL